MKPSPNTAAHLLVLVTSAQFALTGPVVARDRPIRLAQATVTPVTPNSSSATCMSGCSAQSLSCQNTCIATINGTTVIPSMTTVGVTTDPNRCQANCSTQQQQCQRNRALEQ